MTYTRLQDRPVRLELYKVLDSELWGVRLPGGGFYAHGKSQKDALSNAYLHLDQWRRDKNLPYTWQNQEVQDAIREVKRARRQDTIHNYVTVINGEPRTISGKKEIS
jgi:hypothetical protein